MGNPEKGCGIMFSVTDMKKILTLLLATFLITISIGSCLSDEPQNTEECTTVLAAGNSTRNGSIILAKNRDLSEYELQWLYKAPRQSYPPGMNVELQYIEIPQVNVTWAWVGSKSYTKKWGIGMGINEWGVVVADNDAPTREPLEGERGLHDNDICRLILERSKTAQEGMMVAGALIEEYGHANVGQIYWVADPNECWIVECAGHHWAAIRVVDGVAVRANQFQITTHWDAGSDDLVEYAVQKGWCGSAKDFDFAECYSSRDYPYRSSQTRLERGYELTEGKTGDLTREDLMMVLADHYENTAMYSTAHDNQRYRTICNRRTVSAMVAHLKPELPSEMQLMWYCMSSPCISVFMPVYANVSTIPEPYLTGGGPEDISSYDPSSAWWVFKKIQLLVDESYDELHGAVRARWDELYSEATSDTEQLEGELVTLFSEGKRDEAREAMDLLVEEKLTEAYEAAVQAMDELTGAGEETVEEETAEEGTVEEGGVKISPLIYLLGVVVLLIAMVLIARERPFMT